MTRFVVLEPGRGRSARAVFLRDRFSWLAFLFPPVWLLWHRLFLATLGFVVLAVAAAAVGRWEGFGAAGVVLTLLLHLLVALEGPSLRAARLRRRGYRDAAALEVPTRADAEAVYYAGVPEEAEAPAPVPFGVPSGSAPIAGRRWSTGRTLLDAPGAR